MSHLITLDQATTDLINGYSQAKNRIDILNSHSHRVRQEYKDTLPFSESLNQFVCEWFLKHEYLFEFVDTDDFDPDDIEGTLQRNIKLFEEQGIIRVWTGASNNTIFAHPVINHYFRAWHDYIHVTHKLGYDLVGESEVCSIQMAQLSLSSFWDKALIQSEVIGQALHFMKFGCFVSNQRAFTLNYIKTGKVEKY